MSITYAARLGLGPTDPTRINLPSETLGLRGTCFSHVFSLLMPAFSLLSAAAVLPVNLVSLTERSPTTVVTLR